jgi:DNA-binding MarR family transcriptional regulator
LSTPNSGKLSLQNFLPYRLSALSNRLSQSLASKYGALFNISIHEWRIIAVLGEETKLSAAQIGVHVAMDKVAISRAVKKLLSKDYVVRYLDENDNRRFELSLSARGKQVYQQLVPIALESEAQIISQLSEEEICSLRLLIDKLDHAHTKLV